jgi:hypothetical protein
MNLTDTIDRFGDLLERAPRAAPRALQPVDGYTMRLSRTTLAEAERVIRENPELARDMGVTLEDLK